MSTASSTQKGERELRLTLIRIADISEIVPQKFSKGFLCEEFAEKKIESKSIFRNT